MTTNETTKADIPSPPNGSSTPQRKKLGLIGGALVGSHVTCSFGTGIVKGYREEDRMYEIEIQAQDAKTVVYTQTVPQKIQKEQDDIEALNVAYESLEKMRRLNLEMECFSCGVSDVNFECCTTCLLNNSIPSNRFPKLQKMQKNMAEDTAKLSAGFQRFVAATNNSAKVMATTTNANLSKLGTLFQGQKPSTKEEEEKSDKKPASKPIFGTLFPKKAVSRDTKEEEEKEKEEEEENSMDQKPKAQTKTDNRVLHGIQNLLDARLKSPPCLICASPSCKTHTSSNFRKDGITLCLTCEKMFELNFIVDCVSESDPAIRSKHVDRMIDCYDRCLLLLKYSSRFIEPIAKSLEQSKETQNKIGLGSSGAGVLSGVLGIAAAASILTPAGPPLLIASLVFGGGLGWFAVPSLLLSYRFTLSFHLSTMGISEHDPILPRSQVHTIYFDYFYAL